MALISTDGSDCSDRSFVTLTKVECLSDEPAGPLPLGPPGTLYIWPTRLTISVTECKKWEDLCAIVKERSGLNPDYIRSDRMYPPNEFEQFLKSQTGGVLITDGKLLRYAGDLDHNGILLLPDYKQIQVLRTLTDLLGKEKGKCYCRSAVEKLVELVVTKSEEWTPCNLSWRPFLYYGHIVDGEFDTKYCNSNLNATEGYVLKLQVKIEEGQVFMRVKKDERGVMSLREDVVGMIEERIQTITAVALTPLHSFGAMRLELLESILGARAWGPLMLGLEFYHVWFDLCPWCPANRREKGPEVPL